MACSKDNTNIVIKNSSKSLIEAVKSEFIISDEKEESILRQADPRVLTPEVTKTDFKENSIAFIDYSNSDQGYIIVEYTGSNPKVKLLIETPQGITYTYSIKGGQEIFPLTESNGKYIASLYENTAGTSYTLSLSAEFQVSLENEFLPFLYPNQYVMFNARTKCIEIGQTLAQKTDNDLDTVASIYNYVMQALDYDYQKAETVQSGYTPNVDDILNLGKGICFDYAAMMATMLRTQNIPTKMEIGFAGETYHAWISVYIEEQGWINGVIQFDGVSWKLIDPTFADTGNQSKEIMSFINDNSNYIIKYKY
ncbi:MAG: transglutaminase-like domain-containing protein [Lachnospiraceae bacterium]